MQTLQRTCTSFPFAVKTLKSNETLAALSTNLQPVSGIVVELLQTTAVGHSNKYLHWSWSTKTSTGWLCHTITVLLRRDEQQKMF